MDIDLDRALRRTTFLGIVALSVAGALFVATAGAGTDGHDGHDGGPEQGDEAPHDHGDGEHDHGHGDGKVSPVGIIGDVLGSLPSS